MTEHSTQTHKKQVSIKLTSIIYGIVIFFIVAMSLFQVPFKRYSKEYSKHYKTYSSIIKERNQQQDSLLHELGQTLTIKEFKLERLQAWNLSKKKLEKYIKIKNTLAKEHSFLGRGSFKFWLFIFGLVSLGFYFSLKSLFEDFRKPIRTGHEIISIIGISICLFWYYHLFFQTASDFYNETYLLFKLIVSIAISFFISRLIKYYAIKEGAISSLLNLVFRIKSKHFKKMTVKALYAERYDKSLITLESIKQQSNSFDEDVLKTVNNIGKE